MGLLAAGIALAVALTPVTSAGPPKPKRLKGIYEPSGAQPLPDGRVLVIEDEDENPVSILELSTENKPEATRLRPASLVSLLTGQSPLIDVEDLEGIEAGPDGYFYAITSHSRTDEGRRADAREKLIRFRVDGDRLADGAVYTKLRKRITKRFDILKEAAREKDVKDDGGLNIEALSFDRAREKLWVGLRTPVIDDEAIIVVVENPVAMFEAGSKAEIGTELIHLDLDGGGIRAMTYDDRLDGFLILSRREDKKNKAFKLWLWSGSTTDKPDRLRIDMKGDLDNAEGVTPVVIEGQRFLLIVFDDGDASRDKGGHFVLLDYSDIRAIQND